MKIIEGKLTGAGFVLHRRVAVHSLFSEKQLEGARICFSGHD